MSIAVIGMGVVGRAQAELFRDVVTWDTKDGTPYPYADIAACDLAVIAVGTPQGGLDGRADLTYVQQAVTALPPGLPVLLRSTVPPGTCAQLRALRGQAFAHAPEFLAERKGGWWPSSADVPFLILGAEAGAHGFFRRTLETVFPGIIHETTLLEAELAKYTANLAWATRVTFVNEMANICAAAGADWENVRDAWLCDPRVHPAYTSMDGYEPGFGGACWPKDLAALIAASRDAGYEPEFLRAIARVNSRFRGGPGWA
jgi:UDPglucose 6-dehydrogenase